MKTFDIEHEGRKTLGVTREDALELGYPEAAIVGAENKALVVAARMSVRSTIHESVADPETMLGETADVVGLLLMHTLADIIACGDHAANEAQRTRLTIMQTIAGDVDIVALAKATLAKITDKDVILTASLKGVEKVVTDALVTSTKVSQVLITATQKG